MRSPEEQQEFDRLVRVTDAIEERVQASGYPSLTLPEKTFYVIWSLEGEVNNGGFDQYFFNSAGDNARDVVPALRLIGAPVTAALVQRAIEIFPAPGPSADRFTRQKQLDTLPNREAAFEALDDEFYRYPENLERLLAAYAKRNAASFSTPRNAHGPDSAD